MRLFWAVFRIDKGLSLRLGRPSTIQEWDVQMPSNPVACRWAKTADIQGRAYAQLYSISGLSTAHPERAANAAALTSELQCIIEESEQASVRQSFPSLALSTR